MKYLYMLRCGVDHYKVGVASNVKKRVMTLQTSNPNLVEIVTMKLVENAHSAEQEIHNTLHEMRTNGGKEWFALTETQALNIAVMINNYPEVDITEIEEQVTIKGLIREQTYRQNLIEKKLDEIFNLHNTMLENHQDNAPQPEPLKSKYVKKKGDDEFAVEALQLFTLEGKASTSLLQRRLGIGYGRASRIMDLLELSGSISPPNGQHARTVVI